MILRKTYEVKLPATAAQVFSVILATDKGYTSQIIKESETSYLVVASDGQAVRFTQKETQS